MLQKKKTNQPIYMFIYVFLCVYHSCFLPYRAEKERSQYFGEVNDLRHSLDQTANEKVFIMLYLFCDLFPKINTALSNQLSLV